MKSLESKIRNIWIVQGLLISIIFTIIVSAPIYLTGLSSNIYTISIITFVSIFILLTYYQISRYKGWGYEIKNDHLFLKHGVLIKNRSMVPYVRVQHIDTQRGIIDRVVGLSKLVVFTAGSRGADVTIPGLKPIHAEDIQTRLKDEAIESEERDGV